MHCVSCFLIKILRRRRCMQWKFQKTTPKRDINVFKLALFGIGYKKFEFPAHKKNQSLHESNCTLKKVLWVFQSSCVLCVLHYDFFCRAFVNLSVETAITTKIMFDEFVKPNPTFSVWLDTSKVWFFDERDVWIGGHKNINISLRSCFLKFALRASFSTRNFDEKTCDIMRKFRPCLLVRIRESSKLGQTSSWLNQAPRWGWTDPFLATNHSQGHQKLAS